MVPPKSSIVLASMHVIMLNKNSLKVTVPFIFTVNSSALDGDLQSKQIPCRFLVRFQHV